MTTDYEAALELLRNEVYFARSSKFSEATIQHVAKWREAVRAEATREAKEACERMSEALVSEVEAHVRGRAEATRAEREACAMVADAYGYDPVCIDGTECDVATADDIAAAIRARTAAQAEGKPVGILQDKTDDWDSRHAKRRVIEQTENGFVARDRAAPQPPASPPQDGWMREAAQRVVDDILEYERVNNLAPNPPRIYCWDSVAALVAALAHDGGRGT